MADLLNVYDLTRKKTAVLQNAFTITEIQELNKIYSLEFSIPSEDEKSKYLQPFHYIRYGNDGQLYRIIKSELDDGNTGVLKVSCEHVIATLCDDLLFGAVDTSDETTKTLIAQYGGGTINTSAVIKWLLSQQSVKNWELDTCDFNRKFEYLWEQENILNALYGIPKEFSKAYKWQFNTVGYPWKISLKTIDETINPEYYIRAKRNLLSSGSAQDFANICTRIYPLGYGEGVNQLTIKEAKVTGIRRNSSGVAINATLNETSNTEYGNTYIQSSDDIVALYGIKQKVLVDRRFEDPNSLFSYAKTTLEGLQVPSMSRSFDVVDLHPLTNQNIDDAAPGKICKMTGDNTIAYITKTTRVLDDPGNLSIELSTKATDVASSIADLADRVRIESVYAQGATQIYQHSKDANASPEKGSVLNLYFPEEMRQINKVLLKVQLEKFRSYSNTTKSKTVTVQSCDSPEVEVQSCDSPVVTISTNDYSLTGTYTSKAGGGTTSSSGGSTVTVGDGGVVEGGTTKYASNSTDNMTNDLSLSVNGSGVSYLPQESSTTVKTSDSSENMTTGTKYFNADYTSGSASYLVTQQTKLTVSDAGNEYAYVSGSTSDQSDSWSTGPYRGNDYVYDNRTSTPIDWVQDQSSHYHRMQDHRHQLRHDHTIEGSVNTYHGHVVKQDERRDSQYDDGAYYHNHLINTEKFVHNHSIEHYHTVKITGGASGGRHTHTFSIPAHTHTISEHNHQLPDLKHKHTITLNKHSHTIKLKTHSHKIVLNGHEHEITPGIYEFGNPTRFTIRLNDYTSGIDINGKSWEGDITRHLLNDKNQIPRNTWIKVEIIPNDLAYVISSVFVQGFIQSRGGGNY